ncbi:MAG: SGNH/GDSL hydrolase family protein, partial [Deltaproteobacteria bacterium]|nr:SGNH/GDSL hydrolase family protein [Deltaproteobacteria bacterium]
MVDPSTPPSRRRFRLLLPVAGIVGGLAIAEGAARWRHAHPAAPPVEEVAAPRGMFVADAVAGFALAPDVHRPDERFSTNSSGLRDRERAGALPAAGTVRVALVGDSFVAGVGVEDDQHMAALLDDASGALEVWNLGVPHYGTHQSALGLAARWDEVEPDVVVLAVFEGNDVWDDLQGPGTYTVRDGWITRRAWAPWPGDPFVAARAEMNRPVLAHHLPGDGALWRHSYAYRQLLRGAHALQVGGVDRWPWAMEPFDYEAFGGVAWLYLEPPPPPIESAWAITEQVIGQLAADVQARGATFALLPVPAKISVAPEDLRRAFEEGWEQGPREGGGARDGSRSLDDESPGERLWAIARAHGVPRIELLSSLRAAAQNERVYYRDDSHWNAAGHRVAADALAAGLAHLGWIPANPDRSRRLRDAVPIGSAPESFEDGFLLGGSGPGPWGPLPVEDLDRVADAALPIPFGQALIDLTPDEAQLLYPTLIAFSASSAQLAGLLPERLAGGIRGEIQQAVQEDAFSAWVGAMATYSGADGSVTLLIQDTGWEPAQVNRLHSRWQASTLPPLTTGRPLASETPEHREGRFLQAPVVPARPRIVVQAWSEDGDVGSLRRALDALSWDAAERLQGSTGQGPAELPRGPLLPPPSTLQEGLASPAALAASLPEAPEGWALLAQGHGYRREARQNVASMGTALYGRDGGVIEVTVQ